MLKQIVSLCKIPTIAATLCAADQSALGQSRCLTSIKSYLSTLPTFTAPDLKNIVNSLREQGASHLQFAREGKLSGMRDVPGLEEQMQGWNNSGRENLANHIPLGGQLNETTCNPPAGSQALGLAAARMGIAFNAWAINTIRCAAGESTFAPIPHFCPYAVQTSTPNPAYPALRDDPKVCGRSAQGG